ncbi:VOC family protein [Methanobacterium sp.]|uniref:VOC family protein n=1 Tax=Methanobacterium sp. TaxID=2164 RepID=UPI003C74C20A
MKILKTLSRIYVNDLDKYIDFYELLLNSKAELRFNMPQAGLELAQIENILIIAGNEESLKPFKETRATLLVDSIAQFKTFLEEKGSKIIRGPSKVPTGINMTVEHPDGSIFEYVEHKSRDTKFID